MSSNTNKDIQLSGVKHILWQGKPTNIYTQMQNGPCSLISIINALILRGEIAPFVTNVKSDIDLDTLVSQLSNHILKIPSFKDPVACINQQRNVEESFEILSHIKQGIDINIKFDGIQSFEFTKEIALLDMLGIDLYHGWVADPRDIDLITTLNNMSYNMLMESICEWSTAKADSDEYLRYIIANEFLSTSMTQLTPYGIDLLINQMTEDLVGILFRNNHFSTITRKGSKLFTLVTDCGYQNTNEVVWEEVTISGSGNLYNSNFQMFNAIQTSNHLEALTFESSQNQSNVLANTVDQTSSHIQHVDKNQNSCQIL